MNSQPPPPIPPIEVLDGLDEAAFAAAIAPLFEDGDGFIQMLAAARPFGSDQAMIAAAHEIVRAMPEELQVELLARHPRIGADRSAVSALSAAEQGLTDERRAEGGDWVDRELAMLNDAYEERFGFRFVVFVGGRDRSQIIPLIERALRAGDRQAELRRGLDDLVEIAADRLRKLRAG